jgi:peptidoglycan/xylan/chitin deacetylase (PgdA/CDA1 family)
LDRVTKLLALAALALAWHGSATARPGGVRVPILEFHVVGSPAPGAPNPGLYDPPPVFRAQVAWLAREGYHAVTLDAVYRSWHSAGWLTLPPKPVVLTFDDGYPGDVGVALPVLRARGWPAVLNLQVGNLVPARVRLLIAAGWEIDAHTFTHPDLTTVDGARLRREVAGSRTWIQSVFGVPADFFAYPFGRSDPAVVAEARRAGFLGAEGEEPGLASAADGFQLHRIEIAQGDGVAGLAAKLT